MRKNHIGGSIGNPCRTGTCESIYSLSDDKINHTANPIKLHYGMNAREHNVEPMEKTEWNAKQVEISFVNTIQ